MTDTTREVAWQAYWKGYKQALDVESYTSLDEKAAKNKFERYWERENDE